MQTVDDMRTDRRTDRRKRRGGPRGRSNSNERGSAESRRRRKLRLIARYPARQCFTFAERVKCGNAQGWYFETRTISAEIPGQTRCYACGTLLDVDTVTVDRIVPGCQGGKYVDHNIRPSCISCAMATGGQLGAQRRGRV